MDGRSIRKWLLASCLLPGSLGCSLFKSSTPDSPWGSGASNTSLMPSVSDKKPLWSGLAVTTPLDDNGAPLKKGPVAPSTLVAVADVQLEAAFDEKASPTGRQELLDRARQGYQKVLQQNPNDSGALLGLARYYARIGEREKAVETYKKYLTLNQTDKAVPHEVALAHAQWKDWLGAVSWCEWALKMDPESQTARKTMGFCYARAGMMDKALEVMMQVMPEAQARTQVARVMAHQNDFAGCRTQLNLALKANPGYEDAIEFMAKLEENTVPSALNPSGGIETTGGIGGPVQPQPEPQPQVQPQPLPPVTPQP